MCTLLIAAAATGLFAQTGNMQRRMPGRNAQPAQEKTTVSGTLGITHGMISLDSGGTTYYAPGLQRYINFIDGLKAGANVSLEGYVFQPTAGEAKFFRISKLTLAGKDYDFSAVDGPFPGPMMGNNMNGINRQTFNKPDNRSRDNNKFDRDRDRSRDRDRNNRCAPPRCR
jgi:hypothetical protein